MRSPWRFLLVGLLLFGHAACGDDDDTDAMDAATDAAFPCGLSPSGTACTDTATLAVCVNDVIEETTCDVDSVCGPDPSTPGGAACIASGQACGSIEYAGACQGRILAYCAGDPEVLVVFDCIDLYAGCGLVSEELGYNCITPCAAADVPSEGQCMGTTAIQQCELVDGLLAPTQVDCPTGTTCERSTETGWPACVPGGACGDVGLLGACNGAILSRCDEGALTEQDCGATDLVCAYGGDVSGYVCTDPGAMGVRQVTGSVFYADRPSETGTLGAPVPAPSRGVTVALIDEMNGSVAAVSLSSDDGSFVLTHNLPTGRAAHVLAATYGSSAARPIRVIRPNGSIFGVTSASFAISDRIEGREILVPSANGLAQPFNIFDVMVTSMDHTRAFTGIEAPTPLFAQWQLGATDGTYYLRSVNGMFLLGEPSDDDGYDDSVIAHEFGHYFEDEYSRTDSPGGNHDGTAADPRLAWSEGFSTFFSSAVRGTPIYADSNAFGGWAVNLDKDATKAFANLNQEQDVSEDMIGQILWDVSDDGETDDDMAAVVLTALMQVNVTYMTSVADRGKAGADLVDWLDGIFLGRLELCAALRDIVTTTRMFPYDFAPPGGACPAP